MKNLYTFIAFCFFVCPALAQNNDRATIYFNKGKEESTAKLYLQASRHFDTAIQFNKNYTAAYIANGKANIEMRRVTQALGNFSKAFELDPQNQEVIQQLSELYFNNHQFQKAIELVQKCTSCTNASRILGMCYYYGEDYGKAETFLKKAISENSEDAEAAYTLGRTYLELENEKSAIPQYEKAISLKPSQNIWMYELGLIFYNQNDFKSALQYFDNAVHNGYNKTNDYYENYGFAQLYAGDMESGIKTLDAVLTRKPNNRELLNNIANALYETKKYNEALNYFQKLMDINPKDAATLYMAGITLQKMGQKEKGQKICDNAIAMDPSLTKYRQKKEIPGGL